MAKIKESFNKEYNADNTYNKIINKVEKRKDYPIYLKPILISCCVLLLAIIGIKGFLSSYLDNAFYANASSSYSETKSSDSSFVSVENASSELAYDIATQDYGATSDDTNIDLSNSKIIYTTNITIETKDYDSSISLLKDKINQYGGYISDSYIYTYGDNNQYTSSDYTIKIPIDNYQDFINEGNSLGNIESISENSEDITSDYIDIQARLQALQNEYNTVSSLLDKAESLEDIITIHDRLSSLQSNIESYQGQIKYYDSVVDYATIYISISSVENYTTNKSWIDNIKETFINSLNNFVNVLVGIVNLIIYLLPFIFIILIIYVVVVVIKKRKNARK